MKKIKEDPKKSFDIKILKISESKKTETNKSEKTPKEKIDSKKLKTPFNPNMPSMKQINELRLIKEKRK